MQLIYQLEFSAAGSDAEPSADPAAFEDYWGTRKEPEPEVREFAEGLVRQALAERVAIDELIDSAASNWQLDRIARIDLGLLRLAVCELIHSPTIPAAVVIDEAVEIARRFSDAESPGFVNGILDRIARERGLLDADRAAGPAPAQGTEDTGEE